MAVLAKSRAALAKLSALADVRPDLAPIVRAAAAVCESVLDDAQAQITAAKAETAAEIERAADSTEAFARTISERDDAEVKAGNLEIEVSALRAKSALIDFQAQTKRVAIAKAEQVEVERSEDASIVEDTASVVAVLMYLNKAVRHEFTGKSFIESPKKAAGPWQCLMRDGSVELVETRQDAVDVAMRVERESRKSDDSKPRKFPDLGAETSEDTFDAKAKSERVPVSKSVGGKRKPKWAR